MEAESSVLTRVPLQVGTYHYFRLSGGMGLWRNNVKFKLLYKLTLDFISSETFSQTRVSLLHLQNIAVDRSGFFFRHAEGKVTL